MKRSFSCQRAHEARGQTLLMFAFFLVVLILFVGLAIDIGFAYVTKAQLSKAVDAAALEGVRNLSLGDTQSQNLVKSAFAMNYGRPGRDAAQVVPVTSIDPCSDGSGRRCMNVSATATINTFFIRILPQWRTWTVSARVEAVRGRAILSLVLDRSGSMNLNGGSSKLPGAVKAFIDLFDDAVDRAALISYATTVSVDVAMAQPFRTPIKNKVDLLQYAGATFAEGGLSAGYAQIPNPLEVDAINAVVFFTDGLANMIQETVTCHPSGTLMFGGTDSPKTYYAVSLTTSDLDSQVLCWPTAVPPCCSSFTQFTSVNGGTLTPTPAHLRQEGKDRALRTARTIKAAGIIVYSIGLGNTPDAAWLKQVANDPTSGSYDPTLPMGKYVWAQTPADLRSAFQIIGADILSRLTR